MLTSVRGVYMYALLAAVGAILVYAVSFAGRLAVYVVPQDNATLVAQVNESINTIVSTYGTNAGVIIVLMAMVVAVAIFFAVWRLLAEREII